MSAETLLGDGERVAADKQTPDLRRAAELAREQGALAVSRDTAAALSAYQRAAQYEPDNPDNWQKMVGDLLMQSLKHQEAAQAYGRLVALAAMKVRARCNYRTTSDNSRLPHR